jgi:hypothetical protein
MPYHPLQALRRLRLMAAVLCALAGLLNLAACKEKTPAPASPAVAATPSEPQAPSSTSTTVSTTLAATPASADLEAQYKSCPEGYYSGPRPGRVRYTKDDYIWAVTPEFAAAYCMPPEYVDKTLKGAEAIAYKPVYEGYESCGFGGNKEACGRGTFHGFEIYLRSSTKLQSVSDTKFSFSALHMNAYSKHLLSSNALANRNGRAVEQWFNDRPGGSMRTKGWGLVGVKGSVPVWPIVALYEKQYIEDLLPGYNFLSLFGSMGYFSNPRFEKLGVSQFVLRLRKSTDGMKEDEDMDIRTDYAHVIYLPEPFLSKVRQVDKQGAKAFDALVQKALGSPAK